MKFKSELCGLKSLFIGEDYPLFSFSQMSENDYKGCGIVYALCDDRDRKIFYFGMSTSPNHRFSDRDKYPHNLILKKRMKDIGHHLKVLVLCSMRAGKNTKKQLLLMESDLIMFFQNELLNMNGNSFVDKLRMSA